MRKVLLFVASAAYFFNFAFQSEAVITVKDWLENVSRFSHEADLIHGKILLASNLLEAQRFFGNIHYAPRKEANAAEACSFLDRGNDATADLLIRLFPSAGVQFTSGGEGSFTDLLNKCKFSDSEAKQCLINLIAGMFKIDKIAREGKRRIYSKQISQFFDFPFEKFTTPLPVSFQDFKNIQEYLANLGNCIVKSVQLERTEADSLREKQLIESGRRLSDERLDLIEKYPYPPFYTNYLICAYAWSVLDKEDLEELHIQLRKNGVLSDDTQYASVLTKGIFEIEGKGDHYFPFRPGSILQYARAKYRDCEFPDCVETAVRQLFGVLLSTGANDDLKIAKERLKGVDPKLRDFFSQDKTVDEFINKESKELRNQWAEVVSGREGIDYSCDGNAESEEFADVTRRYELESDWKNVIKIFCLLMNGYRAEEIDGYDELSEEQQARAQKAAARIALVNQQIREGNFSISSVKDQVEIVNDLIGIRTDVVLKAEGRSYATVHIYPDNEWKNINTLDFKIQYRHGSLEVKTTGADLQTFETSWIGKLYNNKEEILRRASNSFINPYPLRLSPYPYLDLSLRLNEGVYARGESYLILTEAQSLALQEPHVEAIERKFALDKVKENQNDLYYFFRELFFKDSRTTFSYAQVISSDKAKKFVAKLIMDTKIADSLDESGRQDITFGRIIPFIWSSALACLKYCAPDKAKDVATSYLASEDVGKRVFVKLSILEEELSGDENRDFQNWVRHLCNQYDSCIAGKFLELWFKPAAYSSHKMLLKTNLQVLNPLLAKTLQEDENSEPLLWFIFEFVDLESCDDPELEFIKQAVEKIRSKRGADPFKDVVDRTRARPKVLQLIDRPVVLPSSNRQSAAKVAKDSRQHESTGAATPDGVARIYPAADFDIPHFILPVTGKPLTERDDDLL